MPTPTNPNRPTNLDYAKGLTTGAAYRPSLSLKEAANKIKASPRGAALKKVGVRFTTILKEIIIEKKHHRSVFNSNPWVVNAAAKGQEYTVEAEKWRLVSYSMGGKASEWFLAQHVGANNGFEFWHIANASSLRGASKAISPTAVPAAARTPIFDLVEDHAEKTVEVPVPDNWDD